ncbi:MAG: replication-relaxation family protein [Chthonomonas sp.]|nr:replication-relaxation family protein [Chthonomonas sp.]
MSVVHSSRCVLQQRDRRLLVDLYGHKVLSRDHFIELGHFKSVARCNARLLRLRQGGFIKLLRHPAWGSSSASHYMLSGKAIAVIAEALDRPPSEVARQINAKPALLYLEHTLLLANLRCLFTKALASKRTPFTWLPEGLCLHRYQVGLDARVIKPDSFVRWGVDDQVQNWLIELDLGHASLPALRRKLENYANYFADGACHDAYGRGRFGILFITTGERRVRAILDVLTTYPALKGYVVSQSSLVLSPFETDWQSVSGPVSLMEAMA